MMPAENYICYVDIYIYFFIFFFLGGEGRFLEGGVLGLSLRSKEKSGVHPWV